MATDASLSPDTVKYLVGLADEQRRLAGSCTSHGCKFEDDDSQDASLMQ